MLSAFNSWRGELDRFRRIQKRPRPAWLTAFLIYRFEPQIRMYIRLRCRVLGHDWETCGGRCDGDVAYEELVCKRCHEERDFRTL